MERLVPRAFLVGKWPLRSITGLLPASATSLNNVARLDVGDALGWCCNASRARTVISRSPHRMRPVASVADPITVAIEGDGRDPQPWRVTSFWQLHEAFGHTVGSG